MSTIKSSSPSPAVASARNRTLTPRTSSSPDGDTDAEKKQSTVDNFPPKREAFRMRTVSPPLSSVRLTRVIYLMVGLVTLMLAYYSYRVVQYKREIGGWWSLALGKTPAQVHAQAQGDYTSIKADKKQKGGKNENVVEDRINALAEALGIPSNELASAIAGAVRTYVPPASLSSVAAKETGPAVSVLLSQVEGDKEGGSSEAHTQEETSTGVFRGILHGVASFAGMDEPRF